MSIEECAVTSTLSSLWKGQKKVEKRRIMNEQRTKSIVFSSSQESSQQERMKPKQWENKSPWNQFLTTNEAVRKYLPWSKHPIISPSSGKITGFWWVIITTWTVYSLHNYCLCFNYTQPPFDRLPCYLCIQRPAKYPAQSKHQISISLTNNSLQNPKLAHYLWGISFSFFPVAHRHKSNPFHDRRTH